MSINLIKPCKLRGSELLKCINRNATVLEFWQWAFSDLKSNNIRGIFAEWLVAILLDVDMPVRDSWANWDIETSEGIKIEVKASGYLQSWRQKKPSSISFSGLRAKIWDYDNGLSEKAYYRADIYVFCVQIEKNPESWNALDLNQWRFYILTRRQVEQKGYNSLGLRTICKMSDELTADEFQIKARDMIRIATTKQIPRRSSSE